jgi:CBS domain-containing protein
VRVEDERAPDAERAAEQPGLEHHESAVPATTSVGDVHSRDLISVEPNNDLEEALQLMARHRVRRLPVVENGRLVGMVAQADIALKDNERTGQLVGAISEPSEEERK